MIEAPSEHASIFKSSIDDALVAELLVNGAADGDKINPKETGHNPSENAKEDQDECEEMIYVNFDENVFSVIEVSHQSITFTSHPIISGLSPQITRNIQKPPSSRTALTISVHRSWSREGAGHYQCRRHLGIIGWHRPLLNSPSNKEQESLVGVRHCFAPLKVLNEVNESYLWISMGFSVSLFVTQSGIVTSPRITLLYGRSYNDTSGVALSTLRFLDAGKLVLK